MTNGDDQNQKALMQSLIAQRNMISSGLACHQEYVMKFDPAKNNIENLECRLELIDQIHSNFESVHARLLTIADSLDDETRKSIIEAYNEFCKQFCLTKGLMKKKISQNTREPTKPNENDVFKPTITKLPPIPIPAFNGDVKNWISFRDTFQALVIDQKINDVAKLHYLKEAVKNGEAWKLISDVKVSDDTFEVAWDVLKRRYDNINVIVDSHVSELFKIKSVSSENSSDLWKLIESFTQNLKALETLGEPVDHWSTLVIHMIKYRLDDVSRNLWETKAMKSKQRPTLKQLEDFLVERCHVLESIESSKRKSGAHRPRNFSDKKTDVKSEKKIEKKTHSFVGTAKSNQNLCCAMCNGTHEIQNCGDFKSLEHSQKIETLKKRGLCFKCLTKGHLASTCQQKCESCHGGHHKLIHIEKSQKSDKNDAEKSEKKEESKETICSLGSGSSDNLLMTAQVKIKTDAGNWILGKALLDGGSHKNFISENFAEKLKIEPKIANYSVRGINGIVQQVAKTISSEFASVHSAYRRDAEFLVTPQIAERIPVDKMNIDRNQIPPEIASKLADDKFDEPAEIDILLGVEFFLEALIMNQVKIHKTFPILQESRLGWIVGGNYVIPKDTQKKNHCAAFITQVEFDNELRKFWELEDVGKEKRLTREEVSCEKHFVENFYRKSNGRYGVRIPFVQDKLKLLGDSKAIGLKRFASTEKRLAKDENLRNQYTQFMQEYENLGHMSRIPEPVEGKFYILPHHPVFKPDSTTTKIRVVFNASEKTSSGVSLNDTQMVGPKIQDDLFDIVIRGRKHFIFLSADIEKEFRMIEVHEDDRKYQIVIWRESTEEPLQYYALNTVTYGTASASFLSSRVLRQISTDFADEYPLAAKAIENFLADDFFGGVQTLENGFELQRQLIEMFRKAGMNLRKWSSNRRELLDHLAPEDIETAKTEESNVNSTIKTLGLIWHPETDEYTFNFDIDHEMKVTKRGLLSQILKLFDPVGLLSPVIVKGRMLMQELWLLKCDWDEKLPHEIKEKWEIYQKELSQVSQIRIPRCVIPTQEPKIVELHGFSDSSKKAYGACCYIRSIDDDGTVSTRLLCSKFRVAPLKERTLPELELCGAVLLSRLTVKVVKAMKIEFDSVHLWSDSTIVLSWIKTPSYRLKTFVGNRVSEIQELDCRYEWHHVPSKQNPADLLSRGVSPTDLKENSLWWNGPNFLQNDIETWPKKPEKLNFDSLPETKPIETLSLLTTASVDGLMQRYSSFKKLQRYIAYWNRFIHNKFKKSEPKRSGSLTQIELDEALKSIVRWDQRIKFAQEYKDLYKKKEIDPNSKIKSLNPFMDSHSLIRVGGRLRESKLDYDGRHQILLSKDSAITRKIVLETHHEMGHCGAQALLSALRQKFWIVHGKQLIRSLLRSCVLCAKMKPKHIEQYMGSLPAERVQLIHTFFVTGVDYAGPFLLKEGGVRSKKFTKSWVAVYVCMATKSVHLELVLDLTTKSFIQSLTRFVSRRGRPQTIESDNATTFVGARNQLHDIYEFWKREENSSEIDRFCSDHGIQWKFIPPRSPSMGGEWEAAVKSFKFHLVRIVGRASLTVIEMETVLCKIEAILNSRPLFPESNDPNDTNAVTPEHFLIGRPLVSIAEPHLTEINENRLTRYERVQQMTQHFWQRFNHDYLNSLQVRTKNYKKQVEVKIGQLVVLKDENAKPMHWDLARVVELHPGQDGIVRVITVRARNGFFKRAVNRICPLPVEIDAYQAGEDVETRTNTNEN